MPASNRVFATALLFGLAMVATGVGLALLVGTTALFGRSLGPWVAPIVTFVSLVGVFFLGRSAVLPGSVVRPGRALLVLAVWLGLAMATTAAVAWILPALLVAAGARLSSGIILFMVLVASLSVLDRLAIRDRGE
jgi:hypothetical protein